MSERTGPASITGFTPVEVRYTIPGTPQTLRVARNQKTLNHLRELCRRHGVEIHEEPVTGKWLEAERKGRRLGVWIVLGVVGFFVAAGIGGAAVGGGSGDGDASPGLAFEMCKTFVKRQLKAPSTATFRNFYDDDGEVSATGSGDGPYRIVSTVDSENGFGAKIRSRFSCTVSHTGGDSWHLDAISVN